MTTGQKLKAARQKAGMSQKQLADEMGCSVANISRFENSNSIRLGTMARFAHALGVPMDEIWSEEEQSASLAPQIERLIDALEPAAAAFDDLKRKYGCLSASDQGKVIDYINALYLAKLATDNGLS